ncbi:16S rRNA (adenine(1518)-N(6)/adenine(1519)-N(6))-dimethyltransferase RsmA [Patescibacteria group bacterium]|nr:16S rRNA (adenine(1518)-N(6)/adenine(1519)-N(6))-dimethyltransferase RsmA [Patescibacteria group bacterium]
MSPLYPKEIKQLFSHHGIRAKKYLGQNFLVDQNAIRKILLVAELNKDDVVIEVGPGLGALTQEIAPRVKRLIAIEKDRGMFEILKQRIGDFQNIELINEDILQFDPTYQIRHTPYKVVASLPYAIATSVIRKFLEAEHQPESMVLMIQKEVAQRISAKPPKMNILAVSVQFYATPKIMARVSRNSFWPSPRIDSAILKIIPVDTNKNTNVREFFKVVKAGFSQPRKQLANNLSKELGLEKPQTESWLSQSNIKPTQRAETLTIQDWINLTIAVK